MEETLEDLSSSSNKREREEEEEEKPNKASKTTKEESEEFVLPDIINPAFHSSAENTLAKIRAAPHVPAVILKSFPMSAGYFFTVQLLPDGADFDINHIPSSHEKEQIELMRTVGEAMKGNERLPIKKKFGDRVVICCFNKTNFKISPPTFGRIVYLTNIKYSIGFEADEKAKDNMKREPRVSKGGCSIQFIADVYPDPTRTVESFLPRLSKLKTHKDVITEAVEERQDPFSYPEDARLPEVWGYFIARTYDNSSVNYATAGKTNTAAQKFSKFKTAYNFSKLTNEQLERARPPGRGFWCYMSNSVACFHDKMKDVKSFYGLPIACFQPPAPKEGKHSYFTYEDKNKEQKCYLKDVSEYLSGVILNKKGDTAITYNLAANSLFTDDVDKIFGIRDPDRFEASGVAIYAGLNGFMYFDITEVGDVKNEENAEVADSGSITVTGNIGIDVDYHETFDMCGLKVSKACAFKALDVLESSNLSPTPRSLNFHNLIYTSSRFTTIPKILNLTELMITKSMPFDENKWDFYIIPSMASLPPYVDKSSAFSLLKHLNFEERNKKDTMETRDDIAEGAYFENHAMMKEVIVYAVAKKSLFN